MKLSLHFSPGELAGVAIGGAAILGLVAALIIWCCFRRKSHQTKYVEPHRRAAYEEARPQVSGNATETLYAPGSNNYASYTTPIAEFKSLVVATQEQTRVELGNNETHRSEM